MNPIEAKILLEEISYQKARLNKWETRFVKEINECYVEKRKYLKPGQSAKLQEIYRKSQGG